MFWKQFCLHLKPVKILKYNCPTTPFKGICKPSIFAITLSFLKLIILCGFLYLYTVNDIAMKVQTKRHPSQ